MSIRLKKTAGKLSAVLAVLILSVTVFSLSGTASAAGNELFAGVVSTAGGRLNVRSGPSSAAGILTSIGKGSYVTLLSKSGGWWQVEYETGKTGWSHGDYITKASGTAATVNTSSSNLNVRGGPGTGYSVTGSLPKGGRVVVLSESGGWSKILYAGSKTGYASSAYLKKAPLYAPVSLSVPDFKQTDSRWADVLIGNSGKTIGRIGCTTTAVAMMESYRAGKTIYPDAMSKKLRYSSSGDLYWPSDYVNDTGSGYLETIYGILRQGKPVLAGAKTAAGGQHWVLVTGYTGSDSLTAAGFTVNDPGSKHRVNLQHLFQEYPVFYKLVYYR